jgi:hypothetical protein
MPAKKGNMNILKLPKQEEVSEFDLGNATAKVVEVTDENRAALVEIALSMYVGEKCKYCLHEFKSVADLRERNAVYAGYHEHGRLACKVCWDAANPANNA